MNAAAGCASETSAVACGITSRALPGEVESGDLHLVAPFAGGVLVAVVDGLGHGSEAAVASQIAASTLNEFPYLPVENLLWRCHTALRGSRGVVIGLVSIDTEHNTLTWTGIGNVDVTLTHAESSAHARRHSLLNRGGVVGHQMPQPRVSTHAIAPGDTLVLVTDGIESLFRVDAPSDWQPQQLADYIVGRYGKQTDDALALVVRYIGLHG
jgi:phosphoserine phosphatase RsbX